jgi:ribosomal-protein-alanine N-acetyltransferase
MIILETDRLILRKFKEEDIPSLHSIFSDSETMEYYPAPFSNEKTQNWVKRNQERYKEDGYGLWAVCLKGIGLKGSARKQLRLAGNMVFIN